MSVNYNNNNNNNISCDIIHLLYLNNLTYKTKINSSPVIKYYTAMFCCGARKEIILPWTESIVKLTCMPYLINKQCNMYAFISLISNVIWMRLFVLQDKEIYSAVIGLNCKQEKKNASMKLTHPQKSNGDLSCTHNTKVLINRMTYYINRHIYLHIHQSLLMTKVRTS